MVSEKQGGQRTSAAGLSRGEGRAVHQEVREATGAKFYYDCNGKLQEGTDQRRIMV